MLRGVVICLVLVSCSYVRPGRCMNIILGGIFSSTDNLLDFHLFQPAIETAFLKVRKLVDSGEYLNFSITYILRESNTSCTQANINNAGGLSYELYRNYEVMGFLGPPCSFHTEITADLAVYWNLPVLTGSSTSVNLENKARFQTLTRTSYKSSAIANFLVRLFEYFEWRLCAIAIGDPPEYHNAITVPAILEIFNGAGIMTLEYLEHRTEREDFFERLTEMLVQKARGNFYITNIYVNAKGATLTHIGERSMAQTPPSVSFCVTFSTIH